jgi:IMP dehydrogenase
MASDKFPKAYTFDDILLIPGYSDFTRSDISLKTPLTKKITLDVPFISSPMDTVTESRLAIALGKMGGIGIIHRNLSIEKQAQEVAKVKREKHLVGAAIAGNGDLVARTEALIKAGVDIVVTDTAHGYTNSIIDAIIYLKKTYPNLQVMSGNIATYEGAKAMIKAGVDCIRVGMGPGAICTTRIVSGMGVPQVTAVSEAVRAAKQAGIPVIADGGLRYSGDMVKALALGASACMMGSFFAACEESPGKMVRLTKNEVPARFKSILNHNKTYLFKEYRGMGSVAAMKLGAKIKSGAEFHGKSYYKERVLVAEGVEAMVPVKGTVKKVMEQAIGGIKSGMYYVGAKTIPELHKKAQFYQITQASLQESHPHDVFVTNAGASY